LTLCDLGMLSTPVSCV